MKLTRFACVLAMVVAACGSEGPGGSGGSGGGSGGAGGGSGGAGGGSGGTGGSAGDTVTLSMGPFTVGPGQEVYKCQYFKNPFGGQDTDIAQYENHMTQGSHHMFLFLSTSNQDAPLADCQNGGFEFHPYLFTTGVRDDTYTYPATVGALLPGNQGLEIDAHYINTTQQTLSATVTTILHKAPDGSVTQHAGVIFLNNVGIQIPPGGGSATANCNLPIDMNVLFFNSHMHQRGTMFTGQAAGQTVIMTDQWADPPRVNENPAMHLAAGTPMSWTCQYTNETNQTLTFGESALTNVMCILGGQYYPVPAGRDPLVQCMAF